MTGYREVIAPRSNRGSIWLSDVCDRWRYRFRSLDNVTCDVTARFTKAPQANGKPKCVFFRIHGTAPKGC